LTNPYCSQRTPVRGKTADQQRATDAPFDFPRDLLHTSHNLLMGPKTPRAEGDLLAGTLDMLILKALSRGTLHGYSIARFIQQASQDVLRVEEGALYPALHRLEVRGQLRSEWGTSENNRRAKYYRLTPLGRRALEDETAYWDRLAGAVTRVMQTA
jgi:PadR family transcriptional regulator PadR